MPTSTMPQTMPSLANTTAVDYVVGEPTVPVLGEDAALDLNRSQLVKGDVVSGVVGIEELSVRQGVKGAWYLLKVANQTGRMEMKAWSEMASAMEGFQTGDVVWVECLVGDGYPDRSSVGLTIQAIRKSDLSADVWDLMMPSYQGDVNALDARYRRLTKGMRKPIMALVRAIWREVGFERWREAPGARGEGHHAYRHGLYEHSIEVAEIVASYCDLPRYWGRVDREFAIMSALLHDLGKVEEYAWHGGPIRRSGRGRLSYHTVMGARLIERVWAKNEARLAKQGVTVQLVDMFAHVCESHHREAEYGSPTAPLFVEAEMVAMADDSSAKIASIDDATVRDVSADEEGFSSQRIMFRPNGVFHTPDWRGSSDEADGPDDEPEIYF